MLLLTLCFSAPPSLRFISHGISHCYSTFRGDVRGTAPSFYWTYLLSVCAGGGAWLLLWVTVDRCGRRGILLLSMTMTGLASLILLGLMECKWTFAGSRIFVCWSKPRVRERELLIVFASNLDEIHVPLNPPPLVVEEKLCEAYVRIKGLQIPTGMKFFVLSLFWC